MYLSCSPSQNINKRVDEYVRGIATGGTLFEELGFYYVGPVDGHNLDTLVPILENIRDNVPNTKPVLLHIKTTKGKGTLPSHPHYSVIHTLQSSFLPSHTLPPYMY